ncbi:MAG TPA: L-serine ammonia-lyase, iron-sulfur-dependent, subunit alpha [Lachnospiraceae bacterium]|nr:L-serine ammonia-lyase, iron-sulfur-dependent, subunit alpha [Lachnospiraceae bacterium]
MEIRSGLDLLKECTDKKQPISEVMLEREIGHGKLNRQEVLERLQNSLAIMRAASKRALAEEIHTNGGLISGNARMLASYTKEHEDLCGKAMSRAICYAMSVQEVNASMGLIVAAPTAGSAGVLPGVLFGLSDVFSYTEEQLVKGLLNAGAIGYLVMRNASVSGAEAGCQAEVGSASAMAASAVVELMGGTPKMCLNAAAFAFSNLLGMVCDPVGGLVETPCQSRNVIGVSNAFVCAQLSLSGVEHVVPFDEMTEAMLKVGKSMPESLRETAHGGCAATKAGSAACEACME